MTIARVVLLVFFAALVILPSAQSARLLRLKEKSRLWVRLLGLLGILWAALSLTMNSSGTDLFDSRPRLKPRAIMVRHLLAGGVGALFVVLYTQKLERGPER